MKPELRRIVAVEAQRRKSGRCPVRVHALGTGETFAIEPTGDGFIDVESGLAVTAAEDRLAISQRPPLTLRFTGDVSFEGFDADSGETFSGRAGGGTSVTLYDANGVDYFQYALLAAGDRS